MMEKAIARTLLLSFLLSTGGSVVPAVSIDNFNDKNNVDDTVDGVWVAEALEEQVGKDYQLPVP